MIELNTTWNTVAMLLIAGGVGLIGGVGAALLEIRKDPEKAKECAKLIASSIVLGGIAAVAILYFFPPEESKEIVVKGTSEIVNGYNLTKLVALALIVGSAGASFLLVLQKKALDITEAQKEVAKKTAEVAEKDGDVKAVQAQANEALLNIGSQAVALVKASAMEGTAPAVGKALKKAQVEKPAVDAADAVSAAVEQIGEHIEASAQDPIESLVKDAQQRIYAVTEETGPPLAETSSDDPATE